MTHFLAVFQERKGELLEAFMTHLQISFISLFFAVLIAVPAGIFLTKRKKSPEIVIGTAAILQTIPSLALLGLLIPLFGIGKLPAIIALVAYGLLPILRNTYTGIKEIDPSLIEAADAMGMTGITRLMKVQLPLAMPVIMAGIRTGMVLIVGTATLAALIGAGGLGELILLGIDRNDSRLIILGAVPAALLAILFDLLLRMLEKLSYRNVMATVAAIAAAAGLLIAAPYMVKEEKPDLIIAGKLGAEPEILINMYKLLIEQDTDLNVELKPGFGKTPLVFNALKSGNIDIYPEFTGTVIFEFLKEEAAGTDSREVYEQARKGLQERFEMELLEPMEYNNTYTLAVPKSVADKHGLRRISDLRDIQKSVKAGFTLEFSDREDGYKGIQKKYGLSFSNLQKMEPKLRYSALSRGDINLVDAYSTDSELKQYHLEVLEDDMRLFPPYQGAPLMKFDTIQKYPDIVPALNKLSGNISDADMRGMNYEVNAGGKKPAQVAEEYLKKKGLLK